MGVTRLGGVLSTSVMPVAIAGAMNEPSVAALSDSEYTTVLAPTAIGDTTCAWKLAVVCWPALQVNEVGTKVMSAAVGVSVSVSPAGTGAVGVNVRGEPDVVAPEIAVVKPSTTVSVPTARIEPAPRGA